MRFLVPVLALAFATSAAVAPILAQAPAGLPGVADTARVTAGTYKIETNHTQVVFAVDHFGFSVFRGFFSGATGTLAIDPANVAKTQLSVTLPIASVHTTSDKLNAELVSADWFDAAQFPTATFVSTKVTAGPDDTALVEGNLTIHGVTKPEQMRVHFHGAGTNPMDKALTAGFEAQLMFNRSEFGVTKYVPVVSDHVTLSITGAFEKQ